MSDNTNINRNIISDSSALTNLQASLSNMQRTTDSIIQAYNSNPMYRSFGGYKGLAKMSQYKALNSDDIAADIAQKYHIEPEYLGDVNKRIQNFANEYNVPTYVAGLAFANSIEHDRGWFSKQFWYSDYALGKVTSIDDDVEKTLNQYKSGGIQGELDRDVDNVANMRKALDNYNAIYANAYSNIQQQQNNFNKLRNISNDNPFKLFASIELNDRARYSKEHLDKAQLTTDASINAIKEFWNTPEYQGTLNNFRKRIGQHKELDPSGDFYDPDHKMTDKDYKSKLIDAALSTWSLEAPKQTEAIQANFDRAIREKNPSLNYTKEDLEAQGINTDDMYFPKDTIKEQPNKSNDSSPIMSNSEALNRIAQESLNKARNKTPSNFLDSYTFLKGHTNKNGSSSSNNQNVPQSKTNELAQLFGLFE